MSHALDAIIELAMNASTRTTNKRSDCQVDTLRQSSTTIGTLFVWGAALQLTKLILGSFLGLAPVAYIGTVTTSRGARRLQHTWKRDQNYGIGRTLSRKDFDN